MWFYLKLAWRNLFRNKRRTIIAGLAIGIGLASMMLTDSIMIGMKESMIGSTTDSFLGEAQIHRNGFRQTQEAGLTIHNLEDVVAGLKAEDAVKNLTLRTTSFGMITSPANFSAVLFVGIDPVTEQFLSQVDEALQEGSYFEGDNKRDLVIGNELAELLEVELGDRVVVTVAQAETGDLSQEMFRISGIYHFNIKEMDVGFVFARLPKTQEMLGIGSNVHEIAIKFKDKTFALKKDNPFWESYSTFDNEALSWTEIFPALNLIFGMVGITMVILGAILFGIVAFGIINTLFMSLYERLFEFGVIRAVGTRPGGVRKIILFEAGSLSFVSIFIGTVLGLALIFLFKKIGIDYRGIEFAGTTLTEMLYPVFNIRQFIIYPLATFIFTVFIGFYPALVASKMSVSNALRKSM
jgi:ABC-type lipoprotein release transport system permease subunit